MAKKGNLADKIGTDNKENNANSNKPKQTRAENLIDNLQQMNY